MSRRHVGTNAADLVGRGLAVSVLLLVLVATAIWASFAEAQGAGVPRYSVIDLGTVPGFEQAMYPAGMNICAQVVGWGPPFGLFGNAMLWQYGTITPLGALPGSTDSEAFDINDSGQAVGFSYDGLRTHATLWENGTITPLGTLPGGVPVSSAYGINASGQVVGTAHDASGNARATLWQKGTATDLGTPDWALDASAFGINDSGQVVGDATVADPVVFRAHATLWQNGTNTDLGTLPGAESSFAVRINASGQVVGFSRYYTVADDIYDHATLWENGTTIDLGNLPGRTSSEALGINASGQVVGYSQVGASGGNPPGIPRATLWENGVLRDLNDLIDPNFGWDLRRATAINNRGQIAGVGLHIGLGRAFLLVTPTFTDVPGPYWSWFFVEALVAAGVTAGCDDTSPMYCPEASVTREQMAVFLLRAKEGQTYVPPACTTAPFNDVPCTSPFAPWIAELARRGIVAGCGGGDYCPRAPVTREQMAVFLLGTREATGFNPPACTAATFADVPCSSDYAPWVYELVKRGIAAGCDAGRYCPGDPVTRAQMAVFLVKTFDIPLCRAS